MSYCIYEVDREKKIATITFNRPEKLNAAVTADWNEVKQRVIETEEDDNIKVLIFKGAGRCFGTGHDVADLGPHHGWGGPEDPHPSQRRRMKFDKHVFWGKDGLAQRVLNCDKATIAQVHGYCYGGHHELAIACDITIAADDSTFTHPGYRYIGPLGEIVMFFHTIGVKKTKELMLTGTPLDAMTALQCGLVNKVVPPEKLAEETMKIAETITRQPADAIFMGKAFLELAQDISGIGAGYTAGYITHTLQTNIHYEPGEFNLFREKARKGVKGALVEREAAYKGAPLARSG